MWDLKTYYKKPLPGNDYGRMHRLCVYLICRIVVVCCIVVVCYFGRKKKTHTYLGVKDSEVI